jgi:RimJ/RimL family protein N-acetyltransferase
VIALRPAEPGDADRLLAWRNDPQTRAFAFNSGEVSLEEHTSWLRSRLADPDCVLWVAEDDGVPVGQVRLDREGDAAEVSITVAPEARGRGLAAAILDAAVDAARGHDVARLLARILPGNVASERAFARAGFAVTGRDENGVLTLERSAGRGSDG